MVLIWVIVIPGRRHWLPVPVELCAHCQTQVQTSHDHAEKHPDQLWRYLVSDPQQIVLTNLLFCRFISGMPMGGPKLGRG